MSAVARDALGGMGGPGGTGGCGGNGGGAGGRGGRGGGGRPAGAAEVAAGGRWVASRLWAIARESCNTCCVSAGTSVSLRAEVRAPRFSSEADEQPWPQVGSGELEWNAELAALQSTGCRYCRRSRKVLPRRAPPDERTPVYKVGWLFGARCPAPLPPCAQHSLHASGVLRVATKAQVSKDPNRHETLSAGEHCTLSATEAGTAQPTMEPPAKRNTLAVPATTPV